MAYTGFLRDFLSRANILFCCKY